MTERIEKMLRFLKSGENMAKRKHCEIQKEDVGTIDGALKIFTEFADIVRVWGWSGYFNELDKEYQNHIIRRVEYGI